MKNIIGQIDIPYTICFCICRGKILMLHRKNNPNKNLWNGIGGKIDPGEDPLQAIYREMAEETGLNWSEAKKFDFGGIVSWVWEEPDGSIFYKGMYSFVAYFDEDVLFEGYESAEGFLEWKELAWVLEKSGSQVVPNIPHFLPELIRKKTPREYRCLYNNESFIKMTSHPLPPKYKIKTAPN